MTYLKNAAMMGLIAFSFVFRTGAAYAVPIPTVGAELAVQIDQLTKHIDELKKIRNQISNGVEQSKAMGDTRSMRALKNFSNFLKEKALSDTPLSGGLKSIEITPAMSLLGFTKDVIKDPKKIVSLIERLQKKNAKDEVRKVCKKAQDSMAEQLSVLNLANSFALQQSLASGEEMKKAQEAAAAADDQMQLIGANTATLRVLYQQSITSMAMTANNMALTYLDSLCSLPKAKGANQSEQSNQSEQ